MIKNLLFIVLCYIYFPFRGRSARDINTDSVKKILILQLSQLGDMIHATHLFHHIKNKYPNVRLYVSGSKINKELLADNNDVDEYIVFDENKPLSFIKTLKKEKIDVAILIQTHFIALSTLFLSGVRHIIASTVVGGYSPFETKSYKLIRWMATVVPKYVGKNVSKEYLKFLHPLGINETSIKRYLGFSEGANKNARSFFHGHNISPGKDFIVAISPSTGNKIKNWVEERFAKVADHIYKKYGAKVLIIGGPSDEKEVSSLIGALRKETKVINTLNLFSVDELKAVISHIDMFISGDTGPLYVAEAFGVPTIDILGPVPEYVPPVGELNRIVVNRGGAGPAINPMNNREVDYKEGRRQAKAITVDMVTDEFDDLYVTINSRKG